MGWNIARVQSYIVRGSFYATLPNESYPNTIFFLKNVFGIVIQK